MREEDQQFWIESASAAAGNPAAWLASAESLWRAASAVRREWEEDMRRLREAGFRREAAGPAGWLAFLNDTQLRPMVGQVFMLLAGLAVENLLKGLAVARKPELVQPRSNNPRRLFDWAGSGHVSRRLAQEAGVDLTDAEARVVDRLEVFTRWGGRYPVPLDALEIAPREGETSAPASWSSDDFPILESLYERLKVGLHHAAVDRAEQSAREDADRRAARRPQLLDELADLEKVELEGVTVFENLEVSRDLPGSATGCGTCGAQFSLNERRPAAICRCGTLYHTEPKWDGAVKRIIFNVETYPPAA
jgi:hypothetical protein